MNKIKYTKLGDPHTELGKNASIKLKLPKKPSSMDSHHGWQVMEIMGELKRDKLKGSNSYKKPTQ